MPIKRFKVYEDQIVRCRPDDLNIVKTELSGRHLTIRFSLEMKRIYSNNKNDTMEENKNKKRVLFVCLGNICRAPAAEGVFKTLVERAGKEEA